MEHSFSVQEIKNLQKLLDVPENDTDSEDDLPQQGLKKLGKNDVKCPKNVEEHEESKKNTEIGDDDIWDPSEIKANEIEILEDSREVPEYEMKFKQNVGIEDVFFGMGFKTPGTASCEWLLVSVKMPSENLEKIALTVEADSLDLRSPRYRLHLPTPFPVDPNSSSAKWCPETCTLQISLRLKRELDGINF